MYQSYFQFDARPFPAPPQADFYVPTEAWEETLRTVARAIERAEGPALVVGGVGTGKSLLCHLLAAHYRKVFQVAMLSSTRLCTSRALLQHLLFELNLPYRDRSEGELRFALMEALEPNAENEHGLLLIVDEAQSLSRRLLEEIRMLTNLVRDGQTRVRLVLAGTTRLEEQFAHPRMESFNQRLACRCYLESLTREETAFYIQTQLQAVNGGQAVEIFDDQSMAAVHKLTDGVPRVINQLCDHALLSAAAQQVTSIDERTVEIAWANLQQLPTTFATEESAAPTSHVIEFGQLDDFSEESSMEPLEQSQPADDVVEIGPLDDPDAEQVEAVELGQDGGSQFSYPDAVEEREQSALPLEPGELGLSLKDQDAVGSDEFSQLPTFSSDDAVQVGREWTVVAPFENESPGTAGVEDEVTLILRRDEEHPLGPDHQHISADALERQRQLLERFRQV